MARCTDCDENVLVVIEGSCINALIEHAKVVRVNGCQAIEGMRVQKRNLRKGELKICMCEERILRVAPLEGNRFNENFVQSHDGTLDFVPKA